MVTKKSLAWAAEAAIERLLDVLDYEDNYTVRSAIQLLHDALAGQEEGMTAVDTKCPICSAKRDPRHKVDNHKHITIAFNKTKSTENQERKK